MPEPQVPQAAPAPAGLPRVKAADRHQVVMRTAALDELLPEDHRARVVWDYVERLDLTPLYEPIRAVEGRAGRDVTDPKILMALWLYATLDAVGSARQLDRLCTDHLVYQWICGGVPMNYHTLSDFRTAHVEFLNDLLTQSVAVLMHEGLVTMERVALDGMRVRANAGSSSFRRRKTLETCQAEAAEQVEALQRELDEAPAGSSKRQQAARGRAARERAERIAQALEELKDVEARRKDKSKESRASTTDPQARVMKMADGGFRPAHNVQYATDTQTQVITGADVVNIGSDCGLMGPMIEEHRDRHGSPPGQMLVDGGYVKKEDIEKAHSGEPATIVYAPAEKPKTETRDPYTPRPDDSEAVAQWRQRMGTPEGKEIYKERASTAECVNAISRNRGMQRFLVRGLRKVKAVVLWFALAHNLMRSASLRGQMAVAFG
ncbi:MAG: IS1182 family transposase [bacterium]